MMWSGVCPWCQEPLSRRERRNGTCPSCERSLTADDGRELRPVDLRYDMVRTAQRERYRQLVSAGTVAAGGVAAMVPFLHLAAAVAIPLLVIGHMVAVRVVLMRQTMQLLTGPRRVFTRWICRFSFLWLGLPAYGLAVVPVAGIAAGAGAFAGLTTLVHHYSLWNLQRERDRQPLTAWEKFLLGGLVVLTLAVVAFIVAATLLVGWSVTAVLDLIGAQGR